MINDNDYLMEYNNIVLFAVLSPFLILLGVIFYIFGEGYIVDSFVSAAFMFAGYFGLTQYYVASTAEISGEQYRSLLDLAQAESEIGEKIKTAVALGPISVLKFEKFNRLALKIKEDRDRNKSEKMKETHKRRLKSYLE